MDIRFDKFSLIINGKRVFIKSGSIHYFRVLGEREWYDRLAKMKAGGYNTVDLYFYWGFHEEKKGYFDFDGIKDITKLLETAKKLDMFVIARPGPFINAEISAGGIPYWFLKDKNVIHRNRINGDYVYSKKYMDGLKSWYATIIPIINRFDNIIAFQIENEYSTNGGEDDYIKELYNLAKELGVTVPIFHNDAYIAGLYSDCVDIYACDIYPYINPKSNWREEPFSFDTLDTLEEIVRSFKDNAPIFIAELQAGWYDKWLGYGYDYIRKDMGYNHINVMTKTALSQGVTMFNHYMCAGGTNTSNMASDEVYTSYDFAAPISEFGEIRENFAKAKEINYFLDCFDFSKTEMKDVDFEIPDNCYAKKRYDYSNECEWLFLRNLNFAETQINGININSFDMKILPKNLKLKGCTILSSGLEIFLRMNSSNDEDFVFLFIDEKNSIKIKDIKSNIHEITGDKKDFEIVKFGKTTFIFISYEISNKAWKINNKIIFNADFVYPTGQIGVDNNRCIITFDPDKGFNKDMLICDILPERIKLTDFDVSFCAPEIEQNYDYSSWEKVSQKSDGTLTDAFALDVYSEFIWYKAKISDKIKEISISARHIFAIYINGKELLNRNSYKYDNMTQIDEHITIGVDAKFFNSQNDNEITVLVQNLGFDRGFSNNINSPRGLIYFSTQPHEKIDWYIKNSITLEKSELSNTHAAYLTLLDKNFSINERYFDNDVFVPFMLDMGKTPFRRATIYLNGMKIGRFIRSNSHQDKFYLPPAFLKQDNNIKIVVWEKEHRIQNTWDFKKYLQNVIINIESYKAYQLF